ncbi:MAG: hypothetical protein ACLSIL_16370, partial [Enterococcus casseliflavus]
MKMEKHTRYRLNWQRIGNEKPPELLPMQTERARLALIVPCHASTNEWYREVLFSRGENDLNLG